MKVTKSRIRQIIREAVSAATGTHPGGGVDPNNIRRLIKYFEGSSSGGGLLRFMKGCAGGGNCHSLDIVIGDTFGELKNYEGPATSESRGLYQMMEKLDKLVGRQVKAYLTTDQGKEAIVKLQKAWGAFKSQLDSMGATKQPAPEGEQELQSLAETKKLTKSQIRQIIQEEIATLLSEQEPEVEVWEGVESVPDDYKDQAEALFQRMKEKKMLDSECYRPGYDPDQCKDLPGFWLVGPSDYGYESGEEVPDTDKRLYGEV